MINGVGLGLRPKYLDELSANDTAIKWLEILADNYHDLGNPVVDKICKLLQKYPCVMHSVNLSLASSEPLNEDYWVSLKKVVNHFKPKWLSDHLCFTHSKNKYFHELIPFPFTYNSLDNIANKIDRIQTELKIPFLIENISSYIRFKYSEMSEGEFIRELSRKSGCKILLDVNNIAVTCKNHNESISDYCCEIPFDQVMQIHLAGAMAKNNLLIDTHSTPITDQVLSLYRDIIKKHGQIPSCLEWDMDLPEYDQIIEEVNKIDGILTGKS